VLAHYGVNDMTYNHFSLRVPGEPGHFLVKPTDWMFSEVTQAACTSSILTVIRSRRMKGGTASATRAQGAR